ncbi:MAG: hypothetical protein FWD36_04510 [Treponema sp.]|nr:hypothetical protein [Treponema sp.]
MKCTIKPMLFAALLLAILPASCHLFLDSPTTFIDHLGPIDDNSFYALNLVTNTYYIVEAEILAEGNKCIIWAEKGSGVTVTKAQEMAQRYDTEIRPRILANFGGNNDILQYANTLAGRDDGKLTILLLDIQDGFKDPGKDTFVAGYFMSSDFRPRGLITGQGSRYSNGRDMIYIDTYPGMALRPGETYGVLAHELQHLVTYVSRHQMNRSLYIDTWIEEGLASMAEYFCLGEQYLTYRCEWFATDTRGTIAKGNNFFVWGNHVDKEPQAILDDYATAYLFFHWLYLQTTDTALRSRLYYDIMTSVYTDYRAVTNIAKDINPAWADWEILLRTWLAANYYPQNDHYGYKGSNYLRGKIRVKPISGETTPLFPGEGVYSTIRNNVFDFSAIQPSPNIRYTGITSNTGTFSTPSPNISGNILLTFNANNISSRTTETGHLTGNASITAAAQTITIDTQSETMTGMYAVDVRDVLGRNRE